MNAMLLREVDAVSDTPAEAHSVEAEQSVLGGVLLDNSAWPAASGLMQSDFHSRDHGLIFAAISALIARGEVADIITVADHLRALGRAEQCGGMPYLNSLAQSVPSASGVRAYAGIVIDRAVARSTAAALLAPMGRTVEQIMECGLRRLAATSAPAVPEWVSNLHSWTPPTDLMTREATIEWAITGLIQAGKVGALVAAGGTGKTTMLMILGICVSLGRPFLGCPVKMGSFLLLSADDPQCDLNVALTRVVRAMGLTPAEAQTVAAKLRLVSLQGNVDTDCPKRRA